MAALLSNTTDQDKIAIFLNECRRLNIRILPPDINKSGQEFTLDKNAIRFGLGAIKNLGDAAISQILNNRPYNDIYDLVYKGISKAILETLTYAGCLSKFGSRKSIIHSLQAIMQAVTTIGRNETTLFGTGEELLPGISDAGEYSLEELLEFEKEYLGFYVSSHPLDAYDIPYNCQEIASITEGKAKIAGIVTKVKSGVKNGKPWCFATIEDYTGRLDVLLFGKEIKPGKAYLFQGKVKFEEEKFKLFAYQAKEISRKAA